MPEGSVTPMMTGRSGVSRAEFARVRRPPRMCVPRSSR